MGSMALKCASCEVRVVGAVVQRMAALTIRSGLSHRFVAMKKSIPGKTPKEAVSERSGSSRGDNGFRGLREGRFGADDPPGEKLCSVGRKGEYIFNRRKTKNLIPAWSQASKRRAKPLCVSVREDSDERRKRWIK